MKFDIFMHFVKGCTRKKKKNQCMSVITTKKKGKTIIPVIEKKGKKKSEIKYFSQSCLV